MIRLLDPPLHEFLPSYDELIEDLADLKIQLHTLKAPGEKDSIQAQIDEKSTYLERVKALREVNPMLGTRGVRLGILIPELTKMQVQPSLKLPASVPSRESASNRRSMIPLTSHVNRVERATTGTGKYGSRSDGTRGR